MKILFVWVATTHYFNRLVSLINSQEDTSVFYVVPKGKSAAIGEGVYETHDDINFELFRLDEKTSQTGGLYFVGIDKLILKIKPDIIILGEPHLLPFVYDRKLSELITDLNIKIILKSIPFRLSTYDSVLKEIKKKISILPLPPFKSIPSPFDTIMKKMRFDRLYKKIIIDKKALKQYSQDVHLWKNAFNKADAHVNYIEEAYNIFESYGVPRKKIFITRNSPDTDYYFDIKKKIIDSQSSLPRNNFRIIHLSRLVEWKRVDMLITAVANLKGEFPKIDLLIVGDGPEKENLLRQAEDLQVSDSVNFMGPVYEIELLGKYVMSSSIYVLAGMGGLSINDAMIFGLPVICSVCDGTEKYLVKEGFNGFFFEEGNQKSLESKIRQLFNNPQLRKEMGKKSVQIIEQEVNIHTVLEKYMEAFRYVMKKDPKNKMELRKISRAEEI